MSCWLSRKSSFPAWMLFFAACFSPAGLAEEPDPGQAVELALTISWGEGDRPSDIYAAVVAEDRPWSEPAHEIVLEDDSRVTWSLEPGRYRLVVGAPDYRTVYSPTLDLAPRERHRHEIELERFVPIRGRVVDPEGRPIGGARVGRLRAFLDQFSKRLSTRGEETLARNFLRRTDADGTFELPVHPTAGQFLWVEADHFSPRILRDVRWAGPGSSLGKIALSAGGGLEVHWDRESERASGGLRLQLIPGSEVRLGSITRDDARALWERSAASGSAHWPSLPPGTYDLWLKGPSYAAHRLVPHRVARFDVPTGKTASRTVELPPLGSSEPGDRARRGAVAEGLGLSLFLPEVHLLELEGLEVVRWADDGPVAATSFTAEEASGGSRLDLSHPWRTGTTFLVHSDRLVGVSGELDAQSRGRSIRVDLAPRSTLEGRFLAPPGEQLPGRASILMRPCGPRPVDDESEAERESAARVIPARLGPEGELSSPVPAGCFETAVSIARFAVTEWTAVELPEGGVGSLPPTRLLPGGAILARIVSGRDGLGLEGIRVRAVPVDEVAELYRAVGPGAATSRPPTTPLAGSTSSDGWVRLYGLRAGTWRLALLPGDRRYPHVSAPISIRGPQEVVVDPVELPPPAGLTVRVEVGSSFDETAADPVRIHARGADPSEPLFQLEIDAVLDDVGTARLDEVPPGRWRLSGLVRLESGRLFPVGEETIEIPPGQEVDVTLTLDEPLFRGVVTHRGEPVGGALVLTPRPLDGRRKMTVRLHDDGTFTVPLERAGSYRARVTSLDGRIVDALVPRVEFDDPRDEVEIALPTGRVAGLVLDPDGHPAGSARVKAEGVPDDPGAAGEDSGEDPVQRALRRRVRTDEDGAFVLEGLPPGRWVLRAVLDDLVSDRFEVELGRNEERSGVLLELGRPTDVELLVTARGVLPQSGVRVLATTSPSRPGEVPEAQRGATDRDGIVELRRPEPPDLPVNLMLEGPAGLVTARRTALRDGTSVDLGDAASELRIEIPPHEGGPPRGIFLVTESGAYLNPRWVRSGLSSEGGGVDRLVVPRLADGLWRVVVPASTEELFLVTSGRGLEVPAAATVALDGEAVTVDLRDR